MITTIRDFLTQKAEDAIMKERELAIRYLNDPRGPLSRTLRGIQLGLSRRLGGKDVDDEVVRAANETFYDLGTVFNRQTIEDVVEELRPYIDDKGNASILTSGGIPVLQPADTVDADTLKRAETIEQLLANPVLQEHVGGFFGSSFEVTRTWSIWYYSSRNQHAEWHIDMGGGRRPSTIRLLVFLSDETDRQGAVQIIDKEETRQLLSDHSIEQLRENPSLVEENATVHEVAGEPGSAILFSPMHNLHRATTSPENGPPRKTLLMNLKPIYAPL